MGRAVVVAGDVVRGQCAGHRVPSPAGAPVAAPPLPFSAPLTSGLELSVLVGGRAVAVEGSSGRNTPPHLGLHPSDPAVVPLRQEGEVVAGSATVRAGGKALAHTGCTVSGCRCTAPTLAGGGTSVLVGS